jgi:hypothetical protein
MTADLGDSSAVAALMAAAGEGLTPGGLEWADAMNELAEELLADAESASGAPGQAMEGLAALDAAVQVRRRAVDLLAPELRSAERGVVLLHNLGVDLANRYRLGGGLADLLDACDLGQQVLAAADPGDLLFAAVSLAGRLGLLARNPGHEPALGRAIGLLGDALERTAENDPAHGPAVTTLAGLHVQRWERDGDLAALGAAASDVRAQFERGLITATTPTVVNAATLLLDYGEQTRDLALLHEGEELLRSVVEQGDPTEATTARGNLAMALVTRFDVTGGEELLTQAIALASDAIDARPPGPARAEDLSTRSMARANLGRLRGERPLLDAAISDARAAVAEPAIYSADPNGPANSLAMLLGERYDLYGDSADLDDSIGIYDDLLGGTADVAVDVRPALRVNLANGLLSRFERDFPQRSRSVKARAADDLRRAAGLADAAIAETPPGSLHLAARHDTAGRVRAALAYHLGESGAAEVAEEHAQLAVEATPEGSPDRAHYLNNWAMWVTDRWERTGDPAALDSAIDLLSQALAAAQGDGQLVATINFNLGVRTHQRFELGFDRGEPDWDVLQRACDLLDDALAAEFPHVTLPAGARLGDIAMRLAMWPEAEHALRLALAAAGELTGLRSRQADKQRARSGVQGIGALAALSALRAGDVPAAALHLEQASATLLAESLGIVSDSIRFRDITAACAAMGRSILYLGCSAAGGLGVLTDSAGGCQAVELPDLTDDAVREAVTGFRTTLAAALAETDADPLDACYAAGERLLEWTWTSALAPLREVLSGAGRLALLPLGRLAWLPLAAAGPRGEVPTLAAHEPVLLIRATAPSQASGQGQAAGDEHPDDNAARHDVPQVLIWADTGPADRAIPGVLDEARRVAAVYPAPRLRLHDRLHDPAPCTQLARAPAAPLRSMTGHAAASTPAAASEAVRVLQPADIVHLACHCDVVPAQPEDTVLQVDPPVRVGDMSAGGLRARTHVVLSACDAALTASSLPDEALSPATAMLLAGAGTVTAPVWPVDDEATADFMVAYHRQLAAGTEPGRALSSVQASWAGAKPPFLYAPWVVVVRPGPHR